MRDKRSKASLLKDLLPEVLRETMGEDGPWLLDLRGRWAQVVGENLGKHTMPSRIDDSELVISVEHAVFAQELKMLERELLGRLNQGRVYLTGLKFVIRSSAGSGRA